MAVMESRLMLICGMIFLAVGLQQIGHYMDMHQHQDHFALLSIHVPKRSYKTEITFTSLPSANTSVHTLAEDTLTLEKYDFLDELKNNPLKPLRNVVGFWHIGGGAKFGPGAKLERDMVVRQQLEELKASRIFGKVRIHYRLPRALTYAAAPPRDDRQKGMKLQPAENQRMKQSTLSLLHDDTIKLLQNESSLVPLPQHLPAAFQPHLDRELFEFPTLYALWEHCHLHPDDKVRHSPTYCCHAADLTSKNEDSTS